MCIDILLNGNTTVLLLFILRRNLLLLNFVKVVYIACIMITMHLIILYVDVKQCAPFIYRMKRASQVNMRPLYYLVPVAYLCSLINYT